jgi:hypothetical protein
MQSHNGVSSFPGEWVQDDTLNLYTDASNLGIGAVCGPEWFSLSFGRTLTWLKDFPICWKELYALVKAIATWGEQLRGKRVTLHIDNQTIVYCVNKGASRNSELMILIRELFMMFAKFDLECKAVYINTKRNSSADALSRLDIKTFKGLNPHASPHMTWPSHIQYEGMYI